MKTEAEGVEAIIEVLRLQLSRLEIATNNIRQVLDQLEASSDEDAPSPEAAPHNGPRDRDGILIRIGYRVQFLTRGRHRSTRGIVSRFSRNNERVFAVDANRIEIARAPRNLRVSPVHYE